MDRPLDRARHHRPLAVIDGGMVDDAMAKQRPILHQPEHGISSPLGRLWVRAPVFGPNRLQNYRAGAAAQPVPTSPLGDTPAFRSRLRAAGLGRKAYR